MRKECRRLIEESAQLDSKKKCANEKTNTRKNAQNKKSGSKASKGLVDGCAVLESAHKSAQKVRKKSDRNATKKVAKKMPQKCDRNNENVLKKNPEWPRLQGLQLPKERTTSRDLKEV